MYKYVCMCTMSTNPVNTIPGSCSVRRFAVQGWRVAVENLGVAVQGFKFRFHGLGFALYRSDVSLNTSELRMPEMRGTSRGSTTLETTLGQMAPPKSGRVQEYHLIHVAFSGGNHFWEVPFALTLCPGWLPCQEGAAGRCSGLVPERQGLHLSLTVLCVPSLLNSGEVWI